MFDYSLLEAVAAVIRTGSFDRAGHALGVTPSAVSQRIKLLEERLGVTLVERSKPCKATPTGARLARHVEAVGLLERELAHDVKDLSPSSGRPSLRVAVNADSLATWFLEAVSEVDDVTFDIVLDDEGRTADWLAKGEVTAAISATDRPVRGCDVRALGALRYVATASPAFARRWFADGVGVDSLSCAPSLSFGLADTLQSDWVKQVVGRRIALPAHYLPSSQAFISGSLCGLGWAMNPELLVDDHLETGQLVALEPEQRLSVNLYLQWNRIVSDSLLPFVEAVVRVGKRRLVQD